MAAMSCCLLDDCLLTFERAIPTVHPCPVQMDPKRNNKNKTVFTILPLASFVFAKSYDQNRNFSHNFVF
jgi:hypothetical protein